MPSSSLVHDFKHRRYEYAVSVNIIINMHYTKEIKMCVKKIKKLTVAQLKVCCAVVGGLVTYSIDESLCFLKQFKIYTVLKQSKLTLP